VSANHSFFVITVSFPSATARSVAIIQEIAWPGCDGDYKMLL
jgi:hypothetical protein